jgi:Mrp family chromosome partitioning ATPase
VAEGAADRAGAWLSAGVIAAELTSRLRIGESLHSGLRRATNGTVPFAYHSQGWEPKSMNDPTTEGTSIFAPLWKRKWLILAVAIIVGAGTYLYYKRQAPVYGASTQLYFGSGTEQQGAGNTSSTIGKTGFSGRALTDQAAVINSPIIGLPVRKRLREAGDLAAARAKATAKANNTNDFIAITTEAPTPKAAVALANGYAAEYIKRQRSLYLKNIRTQLVNTREQLRRVQTPPAATPSGSKGKGAAPKTQSSASILQENNLLSKIGQLENALSSYSGVQQVSAAKSGPPLSPKPRQNAIFGFVLGLLLASIAAYVLSRFDRRLRSLGDLEHLYQTQVLAALPQVRNPVQRSESRPRPARPLLEPLRRLYTSLHMGDMLNGHRENRPRVLLVVSPDAGDGRSTLIADLALVQAESGERVAVVEADFRRPTLGRLLEVNAPNGLCQVLAGHVEPAVAMQQVHMPTTSLDTAAGNPGNGAIETAVQATTTGGAVSVLLAGGVAPNPPALLACDAMTHLLRALREEFDYVLIDAPPPLEVSDAMPLLPLVDGIVILGRIGHTRDISAERLAQLLAHSSSAPLLGVVGNCVSRKDIQRYGFTWMPATPGRRRRPAPR